MRINIMDDDSPAVIARRERVFQMFAHAAAHGLRCPGNEENGFRPQDVTALALQGRIIVHIFGYNWRVVGILEEPYLGKWTAPDPKHGRLYRIVDQNGARFVPGPPSTKPIGRHGVRPQPSAPRLLNI